MIIELENRDNGNADALTEAVCRVLKDYMGPYCVESFDPRCIRYLYKHYPQIIRGQLAENAVKRNKSFSWPVRFRCTYCLENFLTRPDFIAYRVRRPGDYRAIPFAAGSGAFRASAGPFGPPRISRPPSGRAGIPIFENFDPKALGLNKQN